MGYRVTISKGIAGRVVAADNIEDFEQPKYGFYWWFWLPKFDSNGGSRKRREVVDVSATWLCFWFGFIFWPTD